MRRSKALPSKTVRNYRSVSQRRMTNHDKDDDDDTKEEQELERLRHLLASSSSSKTPDDDNKDATNSNHDTHNPESNDVYDQDPHALIVLPDKKKKNQNKPKEVELTADEVHAARNLQKQQRRKLQQLQDRRQQKQRRQALYTKLQQHATLTNSQRHLLQSSATLGQVPTVKQQVQQALRKEQQLLTLTRQEHDLLYTTTTVEDDSPRSRGVTSLPNDNEDETTMEPHSQSKEQPVPPSSPRATTDTLSSHNHNKPNRKRKRPVSSSSSRPQPQQDKDDKHQPSKLHPAPSGHNHNYTDQDPGTTTQSKDLRILDNTDTRDQRNHVDSQCNAETHRTHPRDDDEEEEEEEEEDMESKTDNPSDPVPPSRDTNNNSNNNKNKNNSTTSSSLSVAAQMMASFSALQHKQQQQSQQQPLSLSKPSTTRTNKDDDHDDNKDNNDTMDTNDEKDSDDEEQDIAAAFAHHPSYQPGTPIPLSTRAATQSSKANHNHQQKISSSSAWPLPPPLNRSSALQVARYELPVAAMEFELVDAIRNHDVTIVCGETGSGKSTQVPQFLYEAGFTLQQSPPEASAAPPKNSHSNDTPSDHRPSMEEATTTVPSPQQFMIGITQPRRVAAVSTAKRVCHEMGHGTGHSIPSNHTSGNTNNNKKEGGNLVAYQTRYETAGVGPSTRIKFMTDGILLQEIQSDLLLRQYSVICIDEAHERNLNTDALIGLLSLTIPLRRQQAQQQNSDKSSSWLPPLKVVIMSATLRVSDFTDNPKLFARLPQPPVVLKIPGRTFPVTVHHNKVTVLDEYEDAAFSKVCKIHAKLPPGGILVFLTGQQEIVRMVQRLETALLGTTSSSRRATNRTRPQVDSVLAEQATDGDDQFLRDMDDEEVDGELFGAAADQEKEEAFDQTDNPLSVSKPQGDNDTIPLKPIILPLYSMLSTEEQAKVFEPVPDGHRLIVVATNIAETVCTFLVAVFDATEGRYCKTQ